MGWADFCLALGKNLRKPTVGNMKLRELLRERAVRVEHISDADLYMLANGEIRIGADLCVVAAAFGRPDRVNRTVTSRGEHIQMVFKSPDRYVYFDKGIVTAFSD